MRRLAWLIIPVLSLLVHGTLALTVLSGIDRFAKYTDAARQALDGTLAAERVVDLSPLYLYLHKLAAILPGSSGLTLLVVGQLLAVALAAWLLFVLLQKFVPEWLAVTGTLAFIFNRSVAAFANLFEPEAFLLLFLLAFIYFLSAQEGRNRLIAGLFLALSLLTRPTLLPFLVLVPLWFALTGDRARWLKETLLFLALPLLALLLLTARNASLTGEFTPVVMNPGYVFYEGNNPLSSGQSAIYPPLVGEMKTELSAVFDNPHVTYREVARRIAGRKLSVSEVNDFWAGKAINFIIDNPGAFVRKVLTKGLYILHSQNRYDLESARRMDLLLMSTWIPFIPFSFLAVFGLFGVLVDLRRWRDWFLPAMLLLSQSAVMLLMYVSDRQRLPLVPFLILFACLGGQRLLEVRPARRYPAVALLAGLIVLLGLPTAGMQDSLYLWGRYEASDRAWVAAVDARSRGDWTQASAHAARSLGNAPWLADYSRPAFIPFGPDADAMARSALQWRQAEGGESLSDRFDRANLALLAGRPEQARSAYGALVDEDARFERGYLQSSSPGYGLARAECAKGDRRAAIRTAEAALEGAPGDPFLLSLLAALTGDESYEQQIARYFSSADAAMLTGVALLDAGRPADAARRFRQVVRLLPELRRANVYLAVALGRMGAVEQAVALYDKVVADRVDPVLREEAILASFKAFAAADPSEPARLYAYGMVLAQYGHWDAALVQVRAACAAKPDPQWLRSLQWLESLRAG